MKRADVIVVGGGPAGSATALLLARAGHDVLLLERHRFPRRKPCGDCISPGANPILQRLGAWADILRAGPALLQGWQLTSQGGATFGVEFAEVSADATVQHALAIRRDRFDAILLDHARMAGVCVQHEAHVIDLLRDRTGAVRGVSARIDGGRREIAARAVIGADGLRSIVARRLGAHTRKPRLRKTSFTFHARLDRRGRVGEMRLADSACLGVAPVDDGRDGWHNITLVLAEGAFDPRRGVRSIIADGLERFGVAVAANDPDVLACGPFDWPVRAVAYEGAALVGDAAGYYDPFTGQGIYQALAGAELLAGHLDRALRNGGVTRRRLAPYELQHHRLRGSTRRLQQIIEHVCAHPALADFAFRRCARNRPAARQLLGATADLLPAQQLFSPRFLMRLLA